MSGWRLEHDRKMVDGIFGDDWRWIGDQGKVFLVKVNFFFSTELYLFSPKWLKNDVCG